MGTTIVTILYTIINIGVAIYILREIILTIKEADGKPEKRKVKESPFGESEEESVTTIQHHSFNKSILIFAAVLPLLTLTTIYFTVLEPFYNILVAYSKYSGFDISLIYLVTFFAGLTFARLFLEPSSKGNEFYNTNNKRILEERTKNVGVFYLSFTFCTILFSYLDFEFKINIVKGTTTFFLIGNIFYFVFRQNIKSPKSFIFSIFKKNNNSNINTQNDIKDEFDI